ncbi:MAG TPA: sigma factor, partial [Actinomycetota bacterium]
IEGFEGVLAAAQARSEWAVATLYREVQPRVLRYLAAREPREAEDLASDVWLGVARGLGRFRGDEVGFRAWVFTTGFAVTVGATAVPAAPVLTATAGSLVVNLSWTVPADGGSSISGYQILRATISGQEALLATVPPGTAYADFAVVGGTTYFYEVRAVNAEGEGALSNEASATPV